MVATRAATTSIYGISASRYGVMYLVVLGHILGQPAFTNDVAGLMAGTLCRVAVPFFFITSGFFLRPHGRSLVSLVRRPLRQLMPMYVVWTLIYALLLHQWGPPGVVPRLLFLLNGGPAFHLWFLPALCTGLIVAGLAVRLLGVRRALALTALIGAVGLALGAYHDLLGLGGQPRRGGLLMAPLFVTLGVALSRVRRHPSFAVACLLAAAGYALTLAEEWLLSRSLGRFVSHDFLLTTLPYAIGTFLMVQTMPAVAPVRAVARIARLSLPIYLVHLALLAGLLHVATILTLDRALPAALLIFGLASLIGWGIEQAQEGLRTIRSHRRRRRLARAVGQ